jgi:type IV pilus assembly protein PilB
LIVAQRLVRRVCEMCKAEHEYTEEEVAALGIDAEKGGEIQLFKGEGCDTCGGTGYKGRQGLYEVMALSPELRRQILRGVSSDELKETAINEGMLTLRMDGMVKLQRGVTTLEEVVKETAE